MKNLIRSKNIKDSEIRIFSNEKPLVSGDKTCSKSLSASSFGRGKISVGKTHGGKRKGAGRKRKGYSMGRNPYKTASTRLLEETKPFYLDSTNKERFRKFRRVGEILYILRDKGKLLHINPKKMDEHDLAAFIGWCKKELDSSTANKYLGFLGETLEYCGNATLQGMKIRRKAQFPKSYNKSIEAYSKKTIDKLVQATEKVKDEWVSWTLRTALLLYSYTGLRPSELRLAKLEDLDIKHQTILVSNPKGGGRWASKNEKSPIMPGIDTILRQFLQKRNEYLIKNGTDPINIEPLFVFISQKGKVGYWCDSMWRKIKKEVEEISEITFKWKNLRPSYAQICKDIGAPIEVVSRALRHTSTKTTEEFYARIRSETAWEKLRKNWEASTDD